MDTREDALVLVQWLLALREAGELQEVTLVVNDMRGRLVAA